MSACVCPWLIKIVTTSRTILLCYFVTVHGGQGSGVGFLYIRANTQVRPYSPIPDPRELLHYFYPS